MKKYYLIARNMWDQILTYRLDFTVWRIRNVTRLLALYFLWNAVIGKDQVLLGYNQTMMLTYVILGAFLETIVFSSRAYGLADEINNGDLSNFLLRPLNYFLYWAAKDIGDKSMNIVFFLVEFACFLLILRPPFFIQTNPLFIMFFIISIILAIVIFFFCSLLLGMIGFWSSEFWAPRFLFIVVINFFAGGLLPLNMLPMPVFSVLQLFPFTYLLYFPLRIYLGQESLVSILHGFSISCFWVGIFFFITRSVWVKGLKIYTAQGR